MVGVTEVVVCASMLVKYWVGELIASYRVTPSVARFRFGPIDQSQQRMDQLKVVAHELVSLAQGGTSRYGVRPDAVYRSRSVTLPTPNFT